MWQTTVRLRDEDEELAEARAEQERRTVSEVIRSAVHDYVSSDGGSQALRYARRKIAELEAEAARLQAELEAARQGTERTRAEVLAEMDAAFADGLEAATKELPATAPSLAALSGITWNWCAHLLGALTTLGYAQRLEDGQYLPVPGMDIREGLVTAKSLARSPAARIAPSKRGNADGQSPVRVPPEPVAEATAPAEGKNAATKREEPRNVRTERPAPRRRAPAKSRPPVAANGREAVITELREQMEAVAPGTVMFRQPEPGAELVVTAEVPQSCPPHPKRRVVKGFCGACGRNVGTEKIK